MGEMIALQIGGNRAQAYAALPSGQARPPGVVVSFHKNGIDDFTRWLVDELADDGFAAIAPDHFHVLPPGKGPDERRDYMNDEQLALDFRAAVDWLKSKNTVGKPALIGHCMGGRATLVGLVADPELWSCGCMWYGGGAFRKMGKAPPPGELVGALTVPVASFNGSEDTHPSPEEVAKLDAKLTELAKPHEFHRYQGADHSFMNKFGDSYDAAAHKDSWAKAIAFMRRNIAVPQFT